MELYPHNQLAYNKLKESLVDNQRACIIQPTGTGKSFILAKFLSENPNKKFLCITSSNYIIKQFDNNFSKLFSNYDFINYSTLISYKYNEIIKRKYDYIVLDEFHRSGAKEWGSKLNNLLQLYYKTKIIGLTATHERNEIDDNGIVRNMSQELFFGNVAHHLSLREAFDVGILPIPKYIKALYDLESEYERVIKNINQSNVKNKAVLKKYALEKKLDWDNSHGVERVLKKHITSERNFIIFCKNIEHLKQIKKTVEGWFKTAFKKPINTFKVYSSYTDSNNELSAFKLHATNKKKEFNLLFAVQQLNEGLHIPNVQGVLFLRPTDSHIVYYQQLGRCLETKGQRPLVFDMVNNFKTTSKQHGLFDEYYQSVIKESYIKTDYEKYKFKFKIIDEVGDYRELFSNINLQLSSWYEYYKELKHIFSNKDYDKLYGNANLYRWWSKQKKELKNKEKIKLLNGLTEDIGFKYNDNIGFKFLKKYLEIRDIFETNNYHIDTFNLLKFSQKRWLQMRSLPKYFENRKIKDDPRVISQLINILLSKVGIDIEFRTNYSFSAVLKYYLIKNKLLNGVYDSDVSSYLANKRRDYRNGKLNGFEFYLDELNSLLGHNWKQARINTQRTWEDVYNIIDDSLKKELTIELTYKKWIGTQRIKFRNNKLTKSQIDKLNKLNSYLDCDWKVGTKTIGSKN